MSKARANADNHANQLNPNNPAYWSSRGLTPPSPGGGNSGAASQESAAASPGVGDGNSAAGAAVEQK